MLKKTNQKNTKTKTKQNEQNQINISCHLRRYQNLNTKHDSCIMDSPNIQINNNCTNLIFSNNETNKANHQPSHKEKNSIHFIYSHSPDFLFVKHTNDNCLTNYDFSWIPIHCIIKKKTTLTAFFFLLLSLLLLLL